jgi:hypothetical protein
MPPGVAVSVSTTPEREQQGRVSSLIEGKQA